MAKITRLSAEQRDNLVAYLDGELEEPQSQELEQVLAESVVARHEVDMLSRTWDLLNVLPGVKASEEFSRKTLSSLRAAEAPSKSQLGDELWNKIRKGAVLAGGVALLLGAAALSFQATRHWLPDENEELLNDFDVINNLDDYSEVGDIEFLKILKANRTLAEHNEPAQ
jgi:anti-sigma factor RsiW